MFSLSLLTTLTLTLTVVATPFKVVDRSPISLPISKRYNSIGIKNIHHQDQRRYAALRARASEGSNTPLHLNLTVNEFVAIVGVGNPAKNFSLIVDTGSSNTWVGANTSNPYVETSTSIKTQDTVVQWFSLMQCTSPDALGGSQSVSYGTGNFSGSEFLDQVVLAPGLVIRNQSIGVAQTAFGFDNINVDGILGIGPTDLTNRTTSQTNPSTVSTVTDSAFAQHLIPNNLIGISFEPANQEAELNGQITWGDVDPTKFTGNISFVPITKSAPASSFWGIDQSVSYGSTEILQCTSGIVDTGTNLLLLATDAFNKYVELTGAHFDDVTGLLEIPRPQFAKLQSLYFNINEIIYEITPNAQLWPRSLNTVMGGDADKIYLVIADLGAQSGSGVNFINGVPFLQRFYSVYDTENHRLGLATTPFTNATTN